MRKNNKNDEAISHAVTFPINITFNSSGSYNFSVFKEEYENKNITEPMIGRSNVAKSHVNLFLESKVLVVKISIHDTTNRSISKKTNACQIIRPVFGVINSIRNSCFN